MRRDAPEHLLTRRGLVAAWACAATALSGPMAVAAAAPIDLAQYRGKVVYLDFWASWCAPCRLSFPYMERLSSYYAAQPFAVIAVNVDHSRDKAEAFLAQFGPGIHVVFDPDGTLAKRFDVREMPTSVLLDRTGKVRFVHNGFYEERELLYDAHISELLNDR